LHVDSQSTQLLSPAIFAAVANRGGLAQFGAALSTAAVFKQLLLSVLPLLLLAAFAAIAA